MKQGIIKTIDIAVMVVGSLLVAIFWAFAALWHEQHTTHYVFVDEMGIAGQSEQCERDDNGSWCIVHGARIKVDYYKGVSGE